MQWREDASKTRHNEETMQARNMQGRKDTRKRRYKVEKMQGREDANWREDAMTIPWRLGLKKAQWGEDEYRCKVAASIL